MWDEEKRIIRGKGSLHEVEARGFLLLQSVPQGEFVKKQKF
jgi:hypothetical protein